MTNADTISYKSILDMRGSLNDVSYKDDARWVMNPQAAKGLTYFGEHPKKRHIDWRMAYQCTHEENIRRRDWNRLDMERRNDARA